MYLCSSQKWASQKLGAIENWLRLSGSPRAPMALDSIGVSAGKESVWVREAIWDGCRVEWPGGGRPQSKRLAVVEKDEGACLMHERKRLVEEAAGADVCGWTVEDLESDCMKLDVEVADVTVEARVEALEILEATVGGRRVEVMEAGVLLRLVEADRISCDMEVAEVTVELRTTEALEVSEATAGWVVVRPVGAVDDAELFRWEGS